MPAVNPTPQTPPAPQKPTASSQYDKNKQNIFSKPFGKAKLGKMEIKKKNTQKASIFLGIGAVLLAVYSFFFLYPQLQAYFGFESKISGIQSKIENYKTTLSDLEKKRDLHKAAYDKEYKAEKDIIDKVFPVSDEKLEVIRLLENFATHLDAAYPPFEFTSIVLRQSTKENGYTVLPLSTTIHSSQANFDRFLALINLSGNTDPKSPDHIRLMEITRISLRYQGLDATGKDQGVVFNVEMNAYSR